MSARVYLVTMAVALLVSVTPLLITWRRARTADAKFLSSAARRAAPPPPPQAPRDTTPDASAPAVAAPSLEGD